MTNVVFAGGSDVVGVNGEFFGAPNIIQFVHDADQITHTLNEVVYTMDNGANRLVVGGVFTAFDASGNPVAGTITSFTLNISQTVGYPVTLTASGFEMSVSTVYSWIQALNDVALQAALFGAADTVTGTAGNDSLYGHGGHDTFTAGEGNDTIYGDRPSVFFSAAGEPGNDTINGGNGNDIIFGDGANDTLNGEAGNDAINGGEGDDLIEGGLGDDVMEGGAGNDLFQYLSRGFGNDTIIGFQAGDKFLAGSLGVGDLSTLFPYLKQTAEGVRLELMWDGVTESVLFAGLTLADLTSDSFQFNPDNAGQTRTFLDNADVFFGGNGNDTIDARGGNDQLNGGVGNDVLLGGDGDDLIRGGWGNDLIRGGSGADAIDGGNNIDTYSVFDEAAGMTVHLAGGWAQHAGGAIDTLVSIEHIVGTAFADTLVGNITHNTISGGGGDDWIVGLGGNDILEGGPGVNVLIGDDGIDLASYSSHTAAGVWVNMAAGVYSATGVWDVFDGIEGILGGGGDDTIFGNALNNELRGGAGVDALIGQDGMDRLEGGAGADWLVGGNGDDRLVGGEGIDVLTGGAGSDLFDLGATAGWDVAFDYNPAEDRITLDGLSWSGFFTIDADGDGQIDDTLLGYAGGNFVALNVSGLTLEQWNAEVVIDRSASSEDSAISLPEKAEEPHSEASGHMRHVTRTPVAHDGVRDLMSDLTGQIMDTSSGWDLFG